MFSRLPPFWKTVAMSYHGIAFVLKLQQSLTENLFVLHYTDVIIGAMASQLTCASVGW